MQVEQVLEAIVQKLEQDLQTQIKAAQDAHDAATHSESVAETKWDTFGLESSYLAQGQQKRVEETAATLQAFREITPSKTDEREFIELNTLVSVENEGLCLHFFVAVTGGGVKVTVDGKMVTVITPKTPIGQKLLNKEAGDWVEIPSKGVITEYEIVQIG